MNKDMSNDKNKMENQKRMFMAMLLSFIFFIAYDFLYIQPQQQEVLGKEQAAKTQAKNGAPDVKVQDSKATPKAFAQPKVNTAPASRTISSSDVIATIKTNKNIIQIDSFGRVAQVTLLEKQYKDSDGNQLKLFNPDQLRPLEIRFSNREINTEAFKIKVLASVKDLTVINSRKELVLTQKLSKTTVTKTILFYPDGHYDIKIDVSNGAEFFVTPGFRPDIG